MNPVTLTAVLVGKAVPFGRPGTLSAIAKRPVDGRIMMTPEGVVGDEQADRRHHGGPDKAVHHYAWDHYAAWRGELAPTPAVLDTAGAFGENLSSMGIIEADVCVGDILRIGTATVEVSQARQPCWKLNHHFGQPDMGRRVQSTGRTGWYYRVLEAGEAGAGDAVALLERPHADWPLSRLLHVFYLDPLDREGLAGIAALAPLAPSWRQLAQRRLDTGVVEDWTQRLGEA